MCVSIVLVLIFISFDVEAIYWQLLFTINLYIYIYIYIYIYAYVCVFLFPFVGVYN